MVLPQAKEDLTEARLAHLTLPGGAVWAKKAREEALARFRAMGLPGPRDEYWRFTRPDTLNAAAAPEAALFEGDENPAFGDLDRLSLVFRDGVFDADASDALALEGVEVMRLAEAVEQDIHWAKDLYGVLEARGQTPVARPFAALNTAFASDGVVLRVTGKPSKPIHLRYL
ncbi:MAG: Fe-S cluster assembly protein SufD, partial [Pseudomonadota bacterium]